MSEKIKAVEVLTGDIKYVYPHELKLYPKLLKPAPSATTATKNSEKEVTK